MFRIIAEGKNFSEYVLLRDGESVLLRTATPEDVPAVEALMKSVSRESLAMRFMGAVAHVSRSIIEIMCSGDPRDRLSLLAIVGQEPDSQVVGIGNYISMGMGERPRSLFWFSTSSKAGVSARSSWSASPASPQAVALWVLRPRSCTKTSR